MVDETGSGDAIERCEKCGSLKAIHTPWGVYRYAFKCFVCGMLELDRPGLWSCASPHPRDGGQRDEAQAASEVGAAHPGASTTMEDDG